MQHAIQQIKKSLKGLYPEHEISSFCKMIIEHVIAVPYAIALTDKSSKITTNQQEKIDDIVSRLQNFEPIQYILEETEFYGLPLIVNSSVLIPRPETEELIELILNENKKKSLSILDIGTGSGCIAISLKKNTLDSHVSAWDISPLALQTAKRNAIKNNAEIDFQEIDVLGNFPTDKKFDIIVSNPPYVLESEKPAMEKNVLEYEPHQALFVPDTKALIFYERIADIGLELLKEKGKIYFEINETKGNECVVMMKEKGYREVFLKKDIFGKDRFIKSKK